MSDLISGYLEWLRIRGSTKKTISERRKILARVDRELPHGLAAANSDELQAWLYKEEWSRQTKATYYGAVRGFFVWATNPYAPRLDFDPSAMLPRPKVPQGLPKPVSDEQLGRILTQAVDPYRTWAILAAYAGLRCCEIAGLRREHVDEDLIRVVGKGDRPAVVPTHPLVWSTLRDRPAGLIAWTRDGVPATAAYVSINAIHYFARKLRLRGVSMHRLRHWYGTTVYRTTRDIRRTQELLRHRSPTTTAIYTMITSEERTAAIRALPILTES